MNLQLKPLPSHRHTGDVPTRGVHHLALTTDDMKGTVEFYVGVLGMPLVHAMKVPPGLGTGRATGATRPMRNPPLFFDMGNDALMAFFEIPKGAEPQTNRNAIAACSMWRSPAPRRDFRISWSGWSGTACRTAARSNSCRAWSASICSIPTTSGWNSPASRPRVADQRNIEAVTQTKAESAAELMTMDGIDAVWLAEYAGDLPED